MVLKINNGVPFERLNLIKVVQQRDLVKRSCGDDDELSVSEKQKQGTS
jgi:hypothetical protein